MKFGEKFAGLQQFTGEAVDSVGMEIVQLVAKSSFLKHCDRSPEVIVPLHHTIKQDHRYDFMLDTVIVRTQAIVLRAQLAIEGPR